MSSTSHHTVFVTTELAGERLDKALPRLLPALTRTRLQSLIELGCVSLDSPTGAKTIREGDVKVKPGQIYTVIVPEIEQAELKAQDIALDIVFEDAHFLVINKAAGMVVHPAPGNPDSTLVNALLAHCGDTLSGIGGVARPGLVHRIDKDTSGLLVVAKHDAAYQDLSAQLQARHLKRTYVAVCHGVPVPAAGTITGNIGRHPHHRQKMAVVRTGGKTATTHYKVKEIFGRTIASLLECELDTGRTHQIRVHFAHIKHPLLGDPVYGKRGGSGRQGFGGSGKKQSPIPRSPGSLFPRQALHAWKLKLLHPASHKEIQFEAPIPADIQALIEELRAS